MLLQGCCELWPQQTDDLQPLKGDHVTSGILRTMTTTNWADFFYSKAIFMTWLWVAFLKNNIILLIYICCEQSEGPY